MALTELQIKHLKPKEALYRVPDSAGLVIEVKPNGNKMWRYRFRYQGKEQMLSFRTDQKRPATDIA